MNLSDEIRKQIEKNKALKLAVGEINNHLSTLENLVRKDIMEQVDEAYQKGLEDGKHTAVGAAELREKLEYQRGLNDAWGAARKIVLGPDEGGTSSPTLFAIFGGGSMQNVFRNYSAAEAIAKLKAYEEKQKADDKVEVGDEVEVAEKGIKFFVTKIYDADGTVGGINKDGEVRYWSRSLVKPTGRHFNIVKILEGIKHD